MRAEVPEPSIRGAYANPSKTWIIRTYGLDVYERALLALTPDERATYRGEIVSVAWYPLKQWVALLDAVRAEVLAKTGESGETFDRRNLNESISNTMRSVYRIAFGLFSPTTVVSKVTPYFKKVYSHGEYEVVSNLPSRCVLRFSDAPVEMLPELKRSFPIAASWMLDIAGQDVTRTHFVPRVVGPYFSCELTLDYGPRRK
jgi:hypothetical protein